MLKDANSASGEARTCNPSGAVSLDITQNQITQTGKACANKRVPDQTAPRGAPRGAV